MIHLQPSSVSLASAQISTEHHSDSLDDFVMMALRNDFLQQVLFPDPDDESACPTFNGNGSW